MGGKGVNVNPDHTVFTNEFIKFHRKHNNNNIITPRDIIQMAV